ncbi:MAG: hypothetical protein QOI87_3952 [Bradyrhizobium sp.]|jgi:hypothetical protein|nr:hypothetical protein [Bradyrhizobium sp.]
MVTGIWDVAVVAIITDGAEAVVITMDGTGDGTTDAINSELGAALVTGWLLTATGSKRCCTVNPPTNRRRVLCAILSLQYRRRRLTSDRRHRRQRLRRAP